MVAQAEKNFFSQPETKQLLRPQERAEGQLDEKK